MERKERTIKVKRKKEGCKMKGRRKESQRRNYGPNYLNISVTELRNF
jgi:hypothetical protein